MKNKKSELLEFVKNHEPSLTLIFVAMAGSSIANSIAPIWGKGIAAMSFTIAFLLMFEIFQQVNIKTNPQLNSFLFMMWIISAFLLYMIAMPLGETAAGIISVFIYPLGSLLFYFRNDLKKLVHR